MTTTQPDHDNDEPDLVRFNDDWIDDEVVNRALTGHPHPGRRLTHAERLSVAQHLIARGEGAGALSRLLGINGHRATHLIHQAQTNKGAA